MQRIREFLNSFFKNKKDRIRKKVREKERIHE